MFSTHASVAGQKKTADRQDVQQTPPTPAMALGGGGGKRPMSNDYLLALCLSLSPSLSHSLSCLFRNLKNNLLKYIN
jgi:hypothetical protein